MRLYQQAVEEGNFDNDTALLYAYSVYLLHGGTRENFMKLTEDEVQLILSTHLAERDREAYTILKGLGTMFGGKQQ